MGKSACALFNIANTPCVDIRCFRTILQLGNKTWSCKAGSSFRELIPSCGVSQEATDISCLFVPHFPNIVFLHQKGRKQKRFRGSYGVPPYQDMCKIKTSSAEEIARFLDAVLLDGVFRTGAEFCSAEAPSVRCAQKHLGVAKLCEKVKNMFSWVCSLHCLTLGEPRFLNYWEWSRKKFLQYLARF